MLLFVRVGIEPTSTSFSFTIPSLECFVKEIFGGPCQIRTDTVHSLKVLPLPNWGKRPYVFWCRSRVSNPSFTGFKSALSANVE